MRVRFKGVETARWLRTEDAQTAIEALEPGFREDPLSALDSPTCDVDLAGRCLKAFTLRTHANTESRAAARQVLMRAKPGARALHWILHSGAYQTADLVLEPRFLDSIVHCLIAEKADDHVVTWMQSPTPQYLADLPNKQAHSWKGIMLMLLAEHRVFWSNNDMNSAFKPLLQAFVFNDGSLPAPRDQRIGMRSGVTWTLQQLRNSANRSVDPKQYDRFIALYRRIVSTDERILLQLDLAHLSLFHPSTPQADSAFQHIMSWAGISEEEPFHQRYFRPSSKAVAQYIFLFVVRTARMLADQDRLSDARQALRMGHAHIPELFQMRDIGLLKFTEDGHEFDRDKYLQKKGNKSRRNNVLAARRQQGHFW